MAELVANPGEHLGKFDSGTKIIDALRQLGFNIESLCGGNGICGSCKVIIKEGGGLLSSLTESEESWLTGSEIENGYRLSCQAEMIHGGTVKVFVPPETLRETEIILMEGETVEFNKDPSIRKYHVELEPPSLKNPTPDYERLISALKRDYDLESLKNIDYTIQKELPELLRDRNESTNEGWTLAITIYEDKEILNVERGKDEKILGLAVDVGTTTMVGYLIDLQSGGTLDVTSILNPQIEHGEDLMSRAEYAMKQEGGRKEMQDQVIEGINTMINNLAENNGIDSSHIYELDLVGNTAMHHFFLGIDPSALTRSPYVPGRQSSIAVKARELNLSINQSGYAYWLPVNGGWVGADNVSVILASEVHKQPERTLLIDIGTNGEVVFGNNQKAYATSTAAGPALEGGEIKHGTRARPGSIESVNIDPGTLQASYETIDNEVPLGICGSGIIDCAAEMYEKGIVESSGRFSEEAKSSDLVKTNEADILEYIVVPESESSTDSDITITQVDIREIQKAKGAIQTAARLLMNKWGADGLDRVILAGAFGNYIDKASALTIGLFPPCDLGKVESIGNAAGEGAKITLLSKSKKRQAESIPLGVEFVEIAGTQEFNDYFMDSIYFPYKNKITA